MQTPRRHPACPRRRVRGVALLLVMVATASAMVLSLSFLAAQSTTTGIASNNQDSAIARSIAESALRHAIHEVESNDAWRKTYPNGTWVSKASLYGGTVTVSGIDTDGDLTDNTSDPVTLTAIATYKGATYTLRARVNCTPINTKTLLMIVPNPKALTNDETARSDFFTALGWTVNTIADSASSASMTLAMAKASVVYVPGTASAANIGTKLLLATIPVVCEQADLCDEIGVAKQATNTATDTTITIANTSHYITKGLSAGATVLCTSAQPMRYYSSTLGGGVTNLAKTSANAYCTLGVLDTGKSAYGGGSATSRRVVLPFGGASFAWSSLNATGLLIAQRSLDWAYGADAVVAMGTPLVAASTVVSLKNSSVIDSYDSTTGAYSSGGAGKAAVVTSNAITASRIALVNSAVINGDAFAGPGATTSVAITTANSSKITGTTGVMASAVTIGSVSMPASMPASSGNVTYSSGTTNLSSNLRTSKLTISGTAILNITGNVTIQCDSTFTLTNSAQIKIAPGASLKLYCAAGCTFTQSSVANTSYDPSRFQIFSSSTTRISVATSAQVYAVALAPNGGLSVTQNGQFMGTIYGKAIYLTNNGQIHADTAKATATTTTTVSSGSGGTPGFDYTFSWLEKP